MFSPFINLKYIVNYFLAGKNGNTKSSRYMSEYCKTPKCKLIQILVPEEGFQAQRGYVDMCQRKAKVVISIDAERSCGTCASHSGPGKEVLEYIRAASALN